LSVTGRKGTGSRRGAVENLFLKTELELRIANRLVPVLVQIMIQNGNSG